MAFKTVRREVSKFDPQPAVRYAKSRISSCSRMRGVEGTVKVNGRDRSKDPRDMFSRLSCYIMQDDALRPALTIREAMTLVAHLRLGYLTSHKQKQKQVGRRSTYNWRERRPLLYTSLIYENPCHVIKRHRQVRHGMSGQLLACSCRCAMYL